MSPGKARTRRRLSAAVAVAATAIWVGTVALASPAAAAAGDLVLASVSDAGIKGNNVSQEPSLSADGSTVAFGSTSRNLDPADTDTLLDIYVKDLASRDIALASTSDTGIKSNGQNFGPSLSADGNKVAFLSFATNLDPADTAFVSGDIYVKDLSSGDIVLASIPGTGAPGGGVDIGPSLSADGNTVAFRSHAALDPADTDTLPDIYVKNLTSGSLVLASVSDTGINGNGENFAPALSPDGSGVAFSSSATDLDPADQDADADIYVKDLVTGDISLASASESGVSANGHAADPSLSEDGGTVAFFSTASNLDPADTSSDEDIYVKNLASEDITLASTSDIGANPSGIAYGPKLSANGDVVGFVTDSGLDPADRNSAYDVYVKDLTSGDITLASTSASSVSANGQSTQAGLAADGRTVAFVSTARNLDPADRDSREDVYVKSLPIPVAASVGNSTQVEGDAGVRLINFPVTLAAASANLVKVGFRTGRGSATAGEDYQSRTGLITFAPGETAKFIQVRIIGDQLVEALETFGVQLGNPSGGDGTAFGSILNDD